MAGAIPKSLPYDVMRTCHEDPTSGHEGQDKTLKRLEARLWWPVMRKRVKDYVSSSEW